MNTNLCGKCNNEYNNEKNIPIFLPCGHTYCKKCLSDIYKKNSYIICPDDGKKLYLAIDHYPVNHIIMKKITNNNANSNKKPIPIDYNKTSYKRVATKENKEEVDKKVSRKGSSQFSENINVYDSAPNLGNNVKNVSYFEEKNLTELNKDSKFSFQELDLTNNYRNYGQNKTFSCKNLIKSNEIEFSFTQNFEIKSTIENNQQLTKEKDKWESNLFKPDIQPLAKKQDDLTNISKYEENIIFSYFKVMKNIVISFHTLTEDDYASQIQLSEQTYIETEESQDKDLKKHENKTNETMDNCIKNSIFKLILILVVILLNYFVMKNEMFLRVYMFIILSNDTKRSISSGNIKKMSLCSKRW